MAGEVTIVVIGGGIAGVSSAYALARHHTRPAVTLVEAEAQLAHHTTGRSAAQLIENYGTDPIRALTKASLAFFRNPPDGLTDHPLLEPRGILSLARPDQVAAFEQALAQGVATNPTIREVTPTEAAELFPPLRADLLARAMHEPESTDIDVAGLHQAFVRGARAAGATISTDQRVIDLQRNGSGWHVTTTAGSLRRCTDRRTDQTAERPIADAGGETRAASACLSAQTLSADVVVNTAGAWGDKVAAMAGIDGVGLRPLRRTAFMVPSHDDHSERWPLVVDIEHHWYLKPDGRQFLCSPADETPSEPCDAKPEEVDIALAIDRINAATTLGIRSVRSSWAGLRTFSPDRTMVLGPDPAEPSFVWCVGQGGTGIQTAPAAGQLTADLALDGQPGPSFAGIDLPLADLVPDRLR